MLKTEYFWQILFALVGALASGYAGYWFGNQPEAASVIEYQQHSNDNLHRIIGGTEKLQIIYGETPLDALSSISYRIANTSGKNLDKVKIYFDVQDKDILPIFHNVSPPADYPKEAITQISDQNGVYIFELEYLNRTESVWDGIGFSFYFGGSEPPDIAVKTGTKGVSLERQASGRIDTMAIFVGVIKRTWWILLAYLAIGYLYLWYVKAERKAKEAMFRTLIKAELAKTENINENQVVDNILEASKKRPSVTATIQRVLRAENA